MLKYSILMIILIFTITAVFAQNSFQVQHDIENYFYSGTGCTVDGVTVRQVDQTSDGGYAVLFEFQLTDGGFPYPMYQYCSGLLKADNNGSLEWIKMLGTDEDNHLFESMMEFNSRARCFTTTADGGFVFGVSGHGGGAFGLIKIEENGEIAWYSEVVDEGFYAYNGIKEIEEGGFFAIGRNSARYEQTLLRFDEYGDTLWTQHIAEPYLVAWVHDIELMDEDKLLLAGVNYSDSEFKSVLWQYNYNGEEDWQYIDELTRVDEMSIILNTNGIFLCGMRTGTNPTVFMNQVSEDGDLIEGNSYLTPGANYSSFPSFIMDNQGDFVFTYRYTSGLEITKIDSNMNLIWNSTLTGHLGIGPHVLTLTDDDCYFTATSMSDHKIILTKLNSDGEITDSEDEEIAFKDFEINCFPNPFNPKINISLNISLTDTNSNYVLEFYNIKGQLVDNHKLVTTSSANINFVWDASGYASGIYYCNILRDNEVIEVKKIALIK